MALYISIAMLVLIIVGIITLNESVWKTGLVGLLFFLAIGLGSIPSLKGYQYTLWIITAVTAGMIYPKAFLHWGDIDLRNKWLILIVVQAVMFGMGIQMSQKIFPALLQQGEVY